MKFINLFILSTIFSSVVFAQNQQLSDFLAPPPPIKDSSQQPTLSNKPYTNQELNDKHNECLKKTNNIGACKQQYNELSEKGKTNMGYSWQ